PDDHPLRRNGLHLGTVERNSGQKVDRTEWHRVVTFQDGLIDMLEKHAKKGRLIHIEGKMQTRRWRKQGEDSDRFSTEIIVVPGHRVQFYDKPNGAPTQADPAMTGHNGGPPLDDAPAGAAADIEDPPF
ncbi:MAG: single-stranded DNA-binding protein, partial [Defluviicoccus sp.]|nr:single-stranded DNA-binding protein [Defluviicoccus sp.]